VSLFRFIEAEKAGFPISLLCKVLKVSRSGYYAWKGRPPSKRSREDAALLEKIVEVHDRSRHTYGYPRVHAELRALGVNCGRRRVARLMPRGGLKGCLRGGRKSTTRRDPNAVAAPELVGRNFAASTPDRLWRADITYVPTEEGFLYLSFVLDAYSRRLLGWSMAAHLREPSSSSMLFGWRCGGGSPPRGSSITRIAGFSTRHSPSASASKRPGSRPRWGEWAQRWTTPWSRVSSRLSSASWSTGIVSPLGRRPG
jgi:putative transposase